MNTEIRDYNALNSIKEGLLFAGSTSLISSVFTAIIDRVKAQKAIYSEAGDSAAAEICDQLEGDIYYLVEYGKALSEFSEVMASEHDRRTR